MLEEILNELYGLYDYVMQTYRANGKTDYVAGIVEGVRLAIKSVEDLRR